MQFKQSHPFFLKLTTWLIAIVCALCLCFAYQSYQQAHASHQQTLKQQTLETQQHVIKQLAQSHQYLADYVEHFSANANTLPHVVTSQHFKSIRANFYRGDTIQLFGHSTATPNISAALASHLTTMKSALVIDARHHTLFMLQSFADKQGYLVAEINQSQLLDQPGRQQPLTMLIMENRVYLIHTMMPLSDSQLKPLSIRASRFQQGFLDINTTSQKQLLFYTTLKTLDTYASNDWVIAQANQAPTLFAALVNHSLSSVGIFACLISLFILMTFRNSLKKAALRERLTGNTLQFKQRFASHLDAMSAVDNAILSGVKFDDITEISLRQLLATLPASHVGIVKLPASKKELADVQLMTSNHATHSRRQKLDKLVLGAIEKYTDGHVLQHPEDSPFFSGLLNAEPHHVLTLPIFKEGMMAKFIFAAFDPKHVLSDFELGCCRNIGQHLGVALTAISQSEKLYVKEYFDPVSGLFNQQACRERLSQEMSRARRKKEKIAVFQLNLIGYKKINETFGYLMGDQLLKEVGNRLKQNLRDTDILARLGGDDFVIITSDIDKITHANRLADKLTKLFSKPITIYDHTFHVESAIGISVYPQDGITVDEILNHASQAMNKARKIGPNHYAFYEENLSANEAWRIGLEKDLRNAITAQALFMVYQAKINPRNKKISGVEALIRWKHAERGIIKPNEFIALAEESGLIVTLGQYARKEAFSQFVTWKNKGVDTGCISVNVSSYEMQRHEFIPDLTNLISETGIDPSCIELEITESLMLELSGNVMKNLIALHDLGIKIAIDDFGTGYSNLSYLGRMPFDVLKIDKSFMHGIGMQSSANQIVCMMIDMAHHLGKTVCAEGVENDMQYQFLEAAGCDELQGFFLSKPITAKEFETYFQTKQIIRSTSKA